MRIATLYHPEHTTVSELTPAQWEEYRAAMRRARERFPILAASASYRDGVRRRLLNSTHTPRPEDS